MHTPPKHCAGHNPIKPDPESGILQPHNFDHEARSYTQVHTSTLLSAPRWLNSRFSRTARTRVYGRLCFINNISLTYYTSLCGLCGLCVTRCAARVQSCVALRHSSHRSASLRVPVCVMRCVASPCVMFTVPVARGPNDPASPPPSIPRRFHHPHSELDVGIINRNTAQSALTNLTPKKPAVVANLLVREMLSLPRQM